MKTIILNKKTAIEFFDSATVMAKIARVSDQAVSKAPDELPTSLAWPLYYASKLHKYRCKGKLDAIINIK